MKEWLTDPRHRNWIYSVLIAAAPLLVTAGWLTNEAVTAWLNLAAAVLMISGGALAKANTPPGEADAE